MVENVVTKLTHR